MDILIDGLTHWFANTAFFKEDYPESYHALIGQQEELGWHQILLSQFSTLWCDLQNSHLRFSPSTDGKHSGTSWILSMILTIWTEVQSQWEVRNKVKHGDNEIRLSSTRNGSPLQTQKAHLAMQPRSLLSNTFAIHQASLTTYTDL
jgi:hypothetical protein